MPAAASARGATWRSRGGATTGPSTRARTTSTCAIRGRGASGRPPISRSASEPDEYEATFDLDKATFRRRDGDFETQLQIAVSPEDDVEVRRLSIINRGDRPREIEVTSYAEIVLARPEDDLAHPAFGKLFVETEVRPAERGLLFSRRPRGADETPVWAFHVLGVEGRLGGAVEWETDRARFLGRGRIAGQPGRARRPRAVGHDRRRARSGCGAARSRAAARRARSCASRSPPASPRIARRRWRWCGSTATAAPPRAPSRWPSPTSTSRCSTGPQPTIRPCSSIVSRRACSASTRRASARAISARNTLGQPNLWGYGISGDLPIVLVRITEATSSRSSGSCCTRRSTGASRACAPTSSS